MKYKIISKRILAFALSLLIIFSLAACSGQSSSQESNPSTESGNNAENSTPSKSVDTESQNTEQESTPSTDETSAGSNILVVYFSHTGENYSVGVIDKGNTSIIADMIVEETGADVFEIQPKNPYPDIYDDCTDVAKQEQNDNARPEFIGGVENMEQYDTVFVGYPIWWGDLPMVVYSFLERYDFSGKTVIPFCTHEGSGLSGTNSSIESACSGATVLDGLAIRGSVAQNKQDEAKNDVLNWLNGLDY